MDAPPPMDPRHVPWGLTPPRGYRWCLLRTLRDLRRAEQHGRPITPPNARRMFSRRWHRTARRCRPMPSRHVIVTYQRHGLSYLRKHHWPSGPVAF